MQPISNINNFLENQLVEASDRFGVLFDSIEIIVEAIQKLGKLAISILIDVIKSVLEGILIQKIYQFIDQFSEFVTNLVANIQDTIPEDSDYKMEGENIDVDESSLLSNLVGFIPDIRGLFNGISNSDNLYNLIIDNIEASNIIQLLFSQVSSNSPISSFVKSSLSSMYSLILVVSDIFNGFGSQFQLSIFQTDTKSEAREKVSRHNLLILILGIGSELLTQLRGSIGTDKSKLISVDNGADLLKGTIRVIQFLITSVPTFLINNKKRTILNEEFNTDFDVGVRFVTAELGCTIFVNFVGLIGDFVSNRLVKTIVKLIQTTVYFLKVRDDINNFQLTNSTLRKIGLGLSVAENGLKGIITFMQIFKSDFDLPIKARFILYPALDFLEDLFVLQLGDYFEYGVKLFD